MSVIQFAKHLQPVVLVQTMTHAVGAVPPRHALLSMTTMYVRLIGVVWTMVVAMNAQSRIHVLLALSSMGVDGITRRTAAWLGTLSRADYAWTNHSRSTL